MEQTPFYEADNQLSIQGTSALFWIWKLITMLQKPASGPDVSQMNPVQTRNLLLQLGIQAFYCIESRQMHCTDFGHRTL